MEEKARNHKGDNATSSQKLSMFDVKPKEGIEKREEMG